MSRLATLRHIFHIFGSPVASLTTAWMAYYHRFLGKLTSYLPPIPTQLFFFTFSSQVFSLTPWHSTPNNLSNHSTDQITWESYSNDNWSFSSKIHSHETTPALHQLQWFPANSLFQFQWGPNWVFGKTEDHGFLSVKKVKTHFLVKWRNEDWRFI